MPDPMVAMERVVSSNVHSVGYDPAKSELHVRFGDGSRLYVYEGVPPDIHRGLMEAESKGGFMHRSVKGTFPFRRLE
jgi:hypothetical protein